MLTREKPQYVFYILHKAPLAPSNFCHGVLITIKGMAHFLLTCLAIEFGSIAQKNVHYNADLRFRQENAKLFLGVIFISMCLLYVTRKKYGTAIKNNNNNI